eukprot:13973890-Heterocapsa_arctica.AAC.1
MLAGRLAGWPATLAVQAVLAGWSGLAWPGLAWPGLAVAGWHIDERVALHNNQALPPPGLGISESTAR